MCGDLSGKLLRRSMKTNGDDCAFTGQNNVHDSEGNFIYAQSHSGLTKREYMAIKILAGMMANQEGINRSYDGAIKANPSATHKEWAEDSIFQLSASAVSQADALILELNKEKT